MSKPPLHSSSDNPPTPAPESSTAEFRTELARQRAASADAWRGYVESSIVLHRQRAQWLDDRNRELESRLQLAAEREILARQEIDRLAQHVQQLETQWQTAQNQQEPGLRQLLKRRLRYSRPGRMLHTLLQYARLLLPPRGPAKAQIILPVEPPVHEPLPPAPLMQLKPATPHDATRERILLITSHADDSPATRFVLDLAESLQRHCEVLVWHMGDGPLLPEFRTVAAGFMEHGGNRYDYNLARSHARELLAEVGDIHFAITAGKETRGVLPALSALYVPTLTLLHEPEAYATSVYVYQEIFFWTGHTSFTTPAALAQAQRICGGLEAHIASVLVPGPGKRSTPRLWAESTPHAALRHRLGLEDANPPEAIIVGWGALNYKNGVDFFLACADMLVRSSPDSHYRFAWLAQPDETVGDPGYGALIQQQIQALGLEDHVVLVHEPMSLSVPASLADLVLMPARDEVPQHNGLEALQQGLPVLAFQGSTQLARALEANGLAASCLARPGDAAALAALAAALLQDEAQRAALAERLQALDLHALQLESYAQALLAKSRALRERSAQERADEDTIRRSGELRPDYMGDLALQAAQFECTPERLYILGWKTGIGARKPRPGILPSLYGQAVLAAGSHEDAFAHYLRAGSPTGPWDFPVLTPAGNVPLPGPEFPVALHIHAYYPDMLAEILQRLSHNTVRPDLFISVRDAAARTAAARLLESYQGKAQAIEIVPNRGRDIGPFLSSFGAALVQGYELIGHVHTKRSEHADREAVEKWRNFLLENTLGGAASGAMLDNIVCRMAENPSWGMLFPDEPTPFGWDANRATAQTLATRMGVSELPEHFCFPAGTMFWIRAAALRPFVDLDLSYDDYPIEPLPIDGSLLHSLERLFGVIPRSLGMQCVLSSVPGLSR